MDQRLTQTRMHKYIKASSVKAKSIGGFQEKPCCMTGMPSKLWPASANGGVGWVLKPRTRVPIYADKRGGA